MSLDLNLSPIRCIISDSEGNEFEKKQRVVNAFITLIQENIEKQTNKPIDIFQMENNALSLMEQNADLFVSERVGDYDNLHLFRLFAIFIEHKSVLPVSIEELEVEKFENILLATYDGEFQSKYQHIIDHSDCDGFYLPIMFDKPIWLETSDVPEGNIITESSLSIGSSYLLLEELKDLNKFLKIDLNELENLEEFSEKIINDPLELIKWVWAVFYFITIKSIENKIPIIFA